MPSTYRWICKACGYRLYTWDEVAEHNKKHGWRWRWFHYTTEVVRW